MTRGRKTNRQIGERRCLVSGQAASRDTLLRFVLSPDNVVTPDINERLDGRGVWVTANKTALETAVEKKMFARGFKSQVSTPANLVEQVEALLLSSIQRQISLMRRAGEAIAGADRVGEWLQSGEARMLLQAQDGSTREKRNAGPRDGIEWHFEILNRQELGQAFGKDNVVHVALSGNGLINRVYDDANRLAGLRQNKSE